MNTKLITNKYSALILGAIAMTFSGINWQIAFFAWITPICLLFYTRNSKTKDFFFLFAALLVVGYVSQTSNNLFGIFFIGVINAISYAIVYTLVYLIDKLLYQKGKGFYTTLIFPSIFVVIEFLISSVIGTSGIVAQSQFYFYPLAQLSTVTGIFGISFIVVWFASVINWIIERNYSKQSIQLSIYIYAGIFVSIIIFGSIRMLKNIDTNTFVKVATISGNSNLHEFAKNEQSAITNLINTPDLMMPERFFATAQDIQSQINHTIEAAKKEAKIIVWNEDALILSPNQVDSLIANIKQITTSYKTYALIAFLEQNTTQSPKLFNNKSVLITPKGTVGWTYQKSHLAPSEVPIVNAGNNVIPWLDTEYGRLGNIICYDLDFPNYLQQASKDAIDIMLVPAYDWKTYAKLHSKMAQFASLQSGLSLIRSNGDGINMITNGYGKVVAESNTSTSELNILYADLPLKPVITAYSKIGNLFVYLLLLFSLITIGLRIRKRTAKF
ncbi:hypothetical protein OAO55_03360 [Bacteroidales bacterium]|nr:hypothetical protein [Bacteroidales bacterium]